ncbi:Protein of unknown function (DUF1191 [Striga hermonthica]|uniref:Uncharacterized protein n=1 Tax=Striga hermonthica TaxID=68872 RepID=A0A9N7P326_STRHE|nr:Protein of unknown function (DUF1191 [Striga hermonthica]
MGGNILPKPRTGRKYDLSPPVNFSGIQISVVRLRTHRLWANGLNLSVFRIPPRTLPRPYRNRVDFMYQNLGNWSTFYYNVPDHTFVTSVVGFSAYDSNVIPVENELIELNLRVDNPITVRFQNLSLGWNADMRCVWFGANGTVEFTNLTLMGTCVARGQGHFSVVVPRKGGHNKRVFRWWILGFVGGFVGLGMVVWGGFSVGKVWQWKKVGKMERETEKSESLEALWIGNSKMPLASAIRTQPSLESNFVP